MECRSTRRSPFQCFQTRTLSTNPVRQHSPGMAKVVCVNYDLFLGPRDSPLPHPRLLPSRYPDAGLTFSFEIWSRTFPFFADFPSYLPQLVPPEVFSVSPPPPTPWTSTQCRAVQSQLTPHPPLGIALRAFIVTVPSLPALPRYSFMLQLHPEFSYRSPPLLTTIWPPTPLKGSLFAPCRVLSKFLSLSL